MDVAEKKRIVSKFDEKLPGKTIDRCGHGGQFFWIVFTDGTWLHLDSHSYAMHYDATVADYWKAEIGLMPMEEFQRQEAETRRRIQEHRETRERAALAELLQKYPDAVASK